MAFNAKRLAIARRRRGLTKAALADQVGVSSRMITAYEGGEKAPGSDSLSKLADVLQFPSAFFSGDDLSEPALADVSFRALRSLTARRRDQALGSAALALEFARWIDSKFELPDVDLPFLEEISSESAAIETRLEWGLAEERAPNMIHLLELHGVRVFSLVEECRDLDAFSFWLHDVAYVFLNMQKSSEHARMDAAHELGHLVLHRNMRSGDRRSEDEADAFGSAFLMPRESVLRLAPRDPSLRDVVRAKRYWGVSVAALVYRMNKLGLLSEWQYRSLYIEMSRLGYRRNEPASEPRETSQVLEKVELGLRENGISLADVALELSVSVGELERATFGLSTASF